MKYLLFYVDTPDGRHFDWVWIDKWCGMYDVYPVIIDPEGRYGASDTPPYYFDTIAEAVAHPDLAGLQWVWLSENATVYWDEVAMPRDNVIYCLGSDDHGFYGHVGKGQHVQLRAPFTKCDSGPGNPWYASMVVPLLLFHVYQRCDECPLRMVTP